MTHSFSHTKKGTGNTCHFKAKLAEYLTKYGKDLHKENDDNCSHHAKHDEGVGHSTLNLPADLNFLLIKTGQTTHNFVKAAGFFSRTYIGSSRAGKSTGFFHGMGQRTRFFHIPGKKGKDFLSTGRLTVII